jgi:hypothetical protein
MKNNIFIKQIDDEILFPKFIPKFSNTFNGETFNLITWIEIENKFSFWLFPVLFFKNNDSAEMIENVKIIIEFRKKITDIYNIGKSKKVGDRITIGILGGEYAQSFTEVSEGFGKRGSNKQALFIMNRKAEILKDNIETMELFGTENLNIRLLNHQYSNRLHEFDIFVAPDGFMGNALYRAWVSMGFIKNSITFAFTSEKMLPLYIGGSMSDPKALIKLKKKFAIASKGLKNIMKNSVL